MDVTTRAITIRLERNQGRAWRHEGAVHCKGFAFHPETGRLLEHASLAAYVSGPIESFPDRVTNLHGEYAIVLYDEERPEYCAAATDTIRTIPLFYGERGGSFYLSDRADFVARATSGKPTDSIAALEYMMQGMTTGASTLVPEVHQLRAGECLVVDREGVHLNRRPPYIGLSDTLEVEANAHWTRLQQADEAIALLETTFDRILESVGDRPLAIPLSGGLDSRLVACMLARRGRRDVLCFSYGSRRSFEAAISHHVATRLGFYWAFVAYSPRKWSGWYRSESYQQYRVDASQLHTIEHEQDWPAVRELVESGRIREETVVIPGHSGDLLAGSHLPDEVFASHGMLDPVEWIWRKYYRLWPQQALSAEYVDTLKQRISQAIPGYREPASAHEAALVFDLYGWQERQAKMIVNSVRSYEHHGLDWRLPLWHGPFAEFWLRVPPLLRQNKLLYREVLKRLMGPLFDIPAVPESRFRFAQKVREFFDLDFGRYGMYLGPAPLLTALTRRGTDLMNLEEPWAEMLARPLRRQPPQRIPLNGMIALHQLVTTRKRYGMEP